MEIDKSRVLASARAVGIDPERAQALWDAMVVDASVGATRPGFNATTVTYYFGGFLVIGAMTVFMAEGWTRFGSAFVFSTAMLYLVGLATVGWRLYRRPETRVPGGIVVTAAVCVVPLATYGLESMLGIWQSGNPGSYENFYDFIRGSWIWMEIATIAASAIALRFVRFPLLTLPGAFALWYLSMDATDALFGKGWSAQQIQWVSLVFGVAMLVAAIVIDRRAKEDYAFWAYLYGALTLSTGLSLLWTDQLHRFVFLLISLFAMLLSVLLGRRVLTVFGTIGVVAYVGQLAFGIFKTSLLFPFVLTAIGLAIVAAGIWYQRNEERVRRRLLAMVPPSIVAMLPSSRAN